MLPGALSRLPSSFPLRRALALARPGEPLGAWVRMGRWPLHLRVGGRALLASHDLGLLLRRCSRVAVGTDRGVCVLPAERLIAWRALRVVVGTPYLPKLHDLQALFPGLHAAGRSIALPLGLDGPEPVLAACAAARLPIEGSWIEYLPAESG